MKRSLIGGGTVALALALSGPAYAQEEAPAEAVPAAQAERKAKRGPAPEPAAMKLKLRDVRKGRVDVGERFRVRGRIEPWVPGQRVKVVQKRGKKTVITRKLKIKRIKGQNAGFFEAGSKPMLAPGKNYFKVFKVPSPQQEGNRAKTRSVDVRYPDLDPGDRNKDVKLFTKLLRKQAYYTSVGKRYNAAVGRAVLAFRKVNNMPRTQNATPGIFRTLAAGKGGFKLKWPGGGKHIEADLSRQVMVLAKGGRARHIFHVSSGAPATPTIRGKFPTYRKDYGTNSLGMVHSVYFIRGYATHGYHSVPTYPASHGCLRNPIPNSKFIYDWIDIGDVFYVYP